MLSKKFGATLTTRNNRIAQAGFLNRSCAFDARLESILLEEPLKIFFRQHRPIADINKVTKSAGDDFTNLDLGLIIPISQQTHVVATKFRNSNQLTRAN